MKTVIETVRNGERSGTLGQERSSRNAVTLWKENARGNALETFTVRSCSRFKIERNTVNFTLDC